MNKINQSNWVFSAGMVASICGCVSLFIATPQASLVFWTLAYTLMVVSRGLLSNGVSAILSEQEEILNKILAESKTNQRKETC